MNKKLIAGIIAGVAVLVAAVIVILSLTGKVDINLKKGEVENNKTTSSVSSDTSNNDTQSSTESASGDNSSSSVALDSKSTGNKTVKVKDATVKNGKVVVPIYATENDGMCAARIYVNFDTDAFDYADVKAGDMFDDCYGNVTDGQAVILATSSNGIPNISGAGVVANLVLVPKSTITAGEYEVSIDNKKSEYANNNDELVKPQISVGKIIIK